MREEDFSVEDQEAGENYFAKQAQSEFSRVVERERYKQRRGKLLFLRSLGRKGRLSLCSKYGKRWQDA